MRIVAAAAIRRGILPRRQVKLAKMPRKIAVFSDLQPSIRSDFLEICGVICNLNGSRWLFIFTNASWTERGERDLGIEDEFVQRLKAGDADAYEVFVRRFETPLYRYFLASHGDPQLAT